MNPAIARRLNAQRGVQRADLPSPEKREVMELLRGMRRGDKTAAETVLRRIADENDEWRQELSEGAIVAWRRELGSYDLADLHDHYARLFEFDNVSVFRAWQDGLDKVGENAAALKLRTKSAGMKKPTVDALIGSVMQELFGPFADLAANSLTSTILGPGRQLGQVGGWLRKAGFETTTDPPTVDELRVELEQAFRKIDFWGPLPSNRQQVMFGPFGAHLIARYAVEPQETMAKWLTEGKAPPAGVKKSDVRALQGLLADAA